MDTSESDEDLEIARAITPSTYNRKFNPRADRTLSADCPCLSPLLANNSSVSSELSLEPTPSKEITPETWKYVPPKKPVKEYHTRRLLYDIRQEEKFERLQENVTPTGISKSHKLTAKCTSTPLSFNQAISDQTPNVSAVLANDTVNSSYWELMVYERESFNTINSLEIAPDTPSINKSSVSSNDVSYGFGVILKNAKKCIKRKSVGQIAAAKCIKQAKRSLQKQISVDIHVSSKNMRKLNGPDTKSIATNQKRRDTKSTATNQKRRDTKSTATNQKRRDTKSIATNQKRRDTVWL